MRGSALYLLNEIYHEEDHPWYELLHNFVAACNTKASSALGELALVILHCRNNQFSVIISLYYWASVELAAVECL